MNNKFQKIANKIFEKLIVNYYMTILCKSYNMYDDGEAYCMVSGVLNTRLSI